MLNPQDRCQYCFGEKNFRPHLKICQKCLKSEPLFHRLAAVFEYAGPAATLVKHLKYANQSYLAEGMGAFLAYQFYQLKWPVPDLIIPVPLSLTHHFSRGYNQAELIAMALGKIIGSPVKQVLKRKSGDFSQTALDRSQRERLEGSAFFVKKNAAIQDRTILVIDDVLTTGTTLKRCAEALWEEAPKSLYGLTFCRATE